MQYYAGESLAPNFTQVLTAHGSFAFSLYGAFAQANSGKNILFSPLSIFAALSMVLPGAQKETLQQLLSAMHLIRDSGQMPLSPAVLNQLESALGRMLATAVPTGDGGGESGLLSANRAFIQARLEVRPAFLAALRDHFNTTVLTANFIASASELVRINKWVATVTKDKIKDLLQPGSITVDTRLVLVNALYFKAKWAAPFNPKFTMDAPFELSASEARIIVPMMRIKGSFRMVSIPDVLTGVRFDFNDTGSQRMSMLAVLPEQRHGLDALLDEMSEADWNQLVNSPGELMKDVKIDLPKVKLTGQAELSNHSYLPMLGITKMFDPKEADLGGMALNSGNLFVSSFAHQSALQWDEFGAEGVAASAVVVDRESGSSFDLVFDQPFLIIVTTEVRDRDGKPNQVPVFIGRLSDPRL